MKGAGIRIEYDLQPIPEISPHGARTASHYQLLRYTYEISGLNLGVGQALDIEFDPLQFDNLHRGVAGAGFDLVLLAPDNPPGTAGIFSLLALIDNPPLDGPFGVDFEYIGTGQPGPQRFFVNQYDDSGIIVATLASGVTVSTVPEPQTFALGGTGLMMVYMAVRRRRRAMV